jgi:hypothetical protein
VAAVLGQAVAHGGEVDLALGPRRHQQAAGKKVRVKTVARW